jgi:exonuclease-1
MQALKSEGVSFVVAPYEADAQMAYLARSGQVQLVVTEDSDLLAYGCPRCAHTHRTFCCVLCL